MDKVLLFRVRCTGTITRTFERIMPGYESSYLMCNTDTTKGFHLSINRRLYDSLAKDLRPPMEKAELNGARDMGRVMRFIEGLSVTIQWNGWDIPTHGLFYTGIVTGINHAQAR